MCPGLTQSTRGDMLYMWIYIHQHIFISHTPSELNLSQIASAALWFKAYWGGIFPPSSETHVNKWAEVSRVTRGRTSPSSIQKDEKRKWAWCNIRCHVQQKPPCTHTHTHTHTIEHNRVSATSECQHKRLRKGNNPASGSDLEWMKIRLERFSNLCLFEQIGALRIPTSDSPSHIIHVSGSRTRCGITNYWEKTQNKVLLSHKYRTRELPLISLNLELYYGCSLISERRGSGFS